MIKPYSNSEACQALPVARCLDDTIFLFFVSLMGCVPFSFIVKMSAILL